MIGSGQDVTVRNPRFNVQSLRANAVLRWEWRPRSTLFGVWQQDRSAEITRQHTVIADHWRAFEAPGRHYLAIKAVYWLEGLRR